jgi:hypothetical protein
MISIESIAYIQRLLATRKVDDYYMDIYTLLVPPGTVKLYTDADRAFYYLLTHTLPQGTVIASETSVLQVDASWDSKTITKIQEFGGQMSIKLPSPGAIPQIEFIRAIPRI